MKNNLIIGTVHKTPTDSKATGNVGMEPFLSTCVSCRHGKYRCRLRQRSSSALDRYLAVCGIAFGFIT